MRTSKKLRWIKRRKTKKPSWSAIPFEVISLLALHILFSACSSNLDRNTELDTRHPELRRNCPFLLTAEIIGENKDQVLIQPRANEIYNPAFGDECKGDFKRVLEDLPYFADYFELFGDNIAIDFGEIFYAHDTKAGFVSRTRGSLTRDLNGYRGINYYLQKEEQIGRFDEFGSEPFDSEVMIPIGNKILGEHFYRGYESSLNRLLYPFDLRVLSLELASDTTLCRNSKDIKCTNDFPFPNRWTGWESYTYFLGGVRGRWKFTNLGSFKPQYRNCPVIIKHSESSKGLHLWTDRNENYDTDLPNECEGKIETVWKDLELFEPLMKKHAPNILARFHIGFYIDNFPDTQLEISQYLNVEASKRPVDFDLNNYRNQSDDVQKIRSKFFFLFEEKLPEYVQINHTPILNKYLVPHGVKMEDYSIGEKTSFCLVKWDNCIDYFPRNDDLMEENLDLDVFFLGTWDYHWNAQKTVHSTLTPK